MNPLYVEVLDKERAGQGLFAVLEDFTHVDPVRGSITVPKGYITDFASIPFPCRWIIPIAGKSAKAALLHDWVCSRGVTENTVEQRRWSTGIFNRALRENGCGSVRRVAMVGFVTLFKLSDLYL
jgi:hypothetical protein